jgi:hypothetical protein
LSATIFSASSGNGRCSGFASSHGARNHTIPLLVGCRITGIAFVWIGASTEWMPSRTPRRAHPNV